MADFLLELFSEEIPARMQPAAAQQLLDRFAALLAEAGLKAERLEPYVTPRRLALIARGLPSASEAVSEERRGPRADAPAQAVDGFLKSTGLTRDQLEERDTGKGVFLFANLARAGQPTADILAAKLPALIAGFQWPKSQRWGKASISTASPRWVRPLRAIVALLDGDVVQFEALGLQSGRETFGHRFMGNDGPISIAGVAAYRTTLAANRVILPAGERQALIQAGAERAAESVGMVLRKDEGLEQENAGLAEWPVPLVGHFDEAYLNVPPEIIQLTMRTNQKYFACEDQDGKLAPYFVCVANIVAGDDGRTIVAGNERVLSARLSDARFFWEQDKSTSLEHLLPKLEDRLFFEGLGTLRSKSGRIAELSAYFARTLYPDLDRMEAGRAAEWAKADLASATVNEFPEIQGIIGGYMAAGAGESADFCKAIAEQYTGAASNPISVCVSLADRVDTLAAFFSRGLRPTGSKDPFALRRAALQIIQIITANQLRISLLSAFTKADNGLPFTSDNSGWDGQAESSEILGFLIDRLKVQQREAGVRHDLVDAVFALGGEDDLVRLLARVKALQAFVETDDGRNLIAGYKRAANILKAEEKKDGVAYALDLAALESPHIGETEKNLAAQFARAEGASGVLLFDEVDELLRREDFEGAMKRLALLRAPVDRFFEDVTVNDPDPAVRKRRLGLLAGIRDAMHRVADFSKLEG
ncbi:MAG: glycine--tRNA ligase subunit beta [Sphingomonas sp.]|nr:MAG: glycine--tRNA ligase subunit beta [Sphingomonas sp.]